MIALKKMLSVSESQVMLDLEVQYAVQDGPVTRRVVPAEHEFQSWVEAALAPADGVVEMVIRVVGERESCQLNSRYRGKAQPTNVLSFPFEPPPGVNSDHLGDLVICAPVVKREAQQQHKPDIEHWAHLVVHGVLHLRGFDHQTEGQAREMETLEKRILKGLGIQDPYQLRAVSQ